MKTKTAIISIVIWTLMIVSLVLAAGLTAHIGIQLTISQSEADNFSRLNFSVTRGVEFTDGNGLNQVDTLWQDSRTLADDANETLNFHDGSLTDSFSNTVTLDEFKVLYVKNDSNEAALLVGGADANQLHLFVDDVNGVLRLPPYGELLIIAPDANGIDCSVNANLKFEHDGTGSSSLTYDIIVMGSD